MEIPIIWSARVQTGELRKPFSRILFSGQHCLKMEQRRSREASVFGGSSAGPDPKSWDPSSRGAMRQNRALGHTQNQEANT